MKTLILSFLIFISTLICMSCTEQPNRIPTYEYTVKITYCDPRKPDTVVVTEYSEPGNWEIQNRNRSLSEWRNYFNVCDLKVIARTDSLLLK